MEWILLSVALVVLGGLSKMSKEKDALMTKQDFIKKMVLAGVDISRSENIPLQIIVTQAAHESNWGNSQLAIEGNNLFGIKAGQNWVGPVIALPTFEVVNGKEIKITAEFRKYSTYEASVRDWFKFISKPRYVKALAAARANNPKDFFVELQKAGYATDPGYSEKLARVLDNVKAVTA